MDYRLQTMEWANDYGIWKIDYRPRANYQKSKAKGQPIKGCLAKEQIIMVVERFLFLFS